MGRVHLDRPERQKGLDFKVPPLALVAMVAALMWIAARATPAFDFAYRGKTLVSVSLALIGSITCLSGVVAFRGAKTTVNPMKPDAASSLVAMGPYKYTRNPMYLGFVLVLLGWGAFLSNLPALVWIPAFAVYIDRFQIVPEERVLAALFPDAYPAYRAKVRRWI